MPPDIVPVLIRFLAVIGVAVVALVLLERRWQVLTRFRQEPAYAPDLAIARMTVMAAILWETRLPRVLAFAQLDHSLIVPPHGWSHLVWLVPLQSSVIESAYGLLVVAAVLGFVGWHGRIMCGLATLLAFYLETIPQLFGKVNHTANHLVLFGILLAVAPSCDALAIDAVRLARTAAGGDGPRPPGLPIIGLSSPFSFLQFSSLGRTRPRRIRPRAYALTLHTMMLLIGLIYFFPGAWKIARAGTRWFTSDNLSGLLLTKLQEMPMSPIQHWVLGAPRLLWCMTVTTVVFELGFVFAILSPKLRLGAAAAGAAFHALTAIVMGISFTALQLTYVVFVPWTRLVRERTGARRPQDALPSSMAIPSGLRATAAVLLSAMTLVGGAHVVRTWPIACYPTFDLPAVRTVDRLGVAVVEQTGGTQAWLLSFDPDMEQRFGADRWRGLTANFMNTKAPFDARRAHAVLDAWQQVHATPPLRHAVFFADTYVLQGAGGVGSAVRRRLVGVWTADVGPDEPSGLVLRPPTTTDTDSSPTRR